MSNRVRTCMAAVAATASLLVGGWATAMADEVGPAPEPGGALPPGPSTPGPDWVAVPAGPDTPGSHPADGGGVALPPPGSATANVLQINPLDTCVSCTSASAGVGAGKARATALRLLGNDISAGESSGGGSHNGALLAVPASPLLYLAILYWEAASNPGPSSTAHSRAAVVDLALGPTGNGGHPGGVLTVAVLEATSDAGYEGLASKGSGANNGVHLDLGDGALVIIVLHSDASSSNTGSAYVLGINGTHLISSEQTGGSGIPIAVPGVVGLILLQVNASGGVANASVGTAGDLLGQSGQAAGVLAATAVGAAAPTVTPSAGTPPATGTAAGPGLHPPATGVALGITGLVLLPLGLLVLAASLRRRRAARR